MNFLQVSTVLGALCCVSAPAISAQTAVATLPPNYIQVDAPTAQRLILKEKAQHPEIKKLGLHAVPPAATDNAIIANDIESKIGKKSSAEDMKKLAIGRPAAVRIEKDGIYDLLLPISDAQGSSLDGGFLVMEVPFTNASSETVALRIGVAIRDELQRQIPSKAALYQR
jgi:hypothetical protein